MKKRVVSLLLCALFVLGGLTACGKGSDPTSSDPTDVSAPTETGTEAAPTETTSVSGESTAPTTPATEKTNGKQPTDAPKTTKTKATVKALSKDVLTWFEGPLTDIFPETAPSAKSLSAGHIDVTKNETESIQIGVRAAAEELTNLRVSVKGFSGKNAPQISVAPIRLLYNSKASYGFTIEGGYAAKFRRADAPGDIPEYYDVNNDIVGLERGMKYSIPAQKSAGIVVEVTTTKSTAPGEYQTVVELNGDQGSRSVPITVKVWDVTLPDPKDSSFSYTNWFCSANMNQSGFPMFMDAYYDAAGFNENFFTVIENFARVMKKERQNVIFVPTMALLASDMTIDGSGNYQFTFKNFDKYVETFLRYGSVKSLEGCTFYDKDWYVTPPTEPNTWPTDSLASIIFVREGNKYVTKWVKADSAEAKKHFDQLIPALYKHLKSKGWEKMWLQHVCDEPLSDLQAKQSSAMYNRILKEMPGVRTLDAGSNQIKNYPNGELTINCPQLDDYERSRNAYNALPAKGYELWTYTCVNPQGNYMTRIADYPLISARVIGWYDWQQGVTGYLHWGWNLWQQAKFSANDPFTDIYCDSAAADAFLVYPDAANMSVYEGPRATAVRDSWEDYELLTLAAKKNRSKTNEIVNKTVTNGMVFEREPAKLTASRLALLKIAAGQA